MQRKRAVGQPRLGGCFVAAAFVPKKQLWRPFSASSFKVEHRTAASHVAATTTRSRSSLQFKHEHTALVAKVAAHACPPRANCVVGSPKSNINQRANKQVLDLLLCCVVLCFFFSLFLFLFSFSLPP